MVYWTKFSYDKIKLYILKVYNVTFCIEKTKQEKNQTDAYWAPPQLNKLYFLMIDLGSPKVL